VEALNLTDFLEIIFPTPPACPLCGAPLSPREQQVCTGCLDKVKSWQDTGRCGGCGRPAAGAAFCRACAAQPPPFGWFRSAGPYQGELKKALVNLKFHGRSDLARPLARLLSIVSGVAAAELLVPVPITPARQRERGYNQAALLTGELSILVDRPQAGVLEKVRRTSDQVGLSRRERLANVRGAFRAAKPDLIRGKKMLLVDDVFTTGATAGECASALLAAGAAEVNVVTVAFSRQI